MLRTPAAPGKRKAYVDHSEQDKLLCIFLDTRKQLRKLRSLGVNKDDILWKYYVNRMASIGRLSRKEVK